MPYIWSTLQISSIWTNYIYFSEIMQISVCVLVLGHKVLGPRKQDLQEACILDSCWSNLEWKDASKGVQLEWVSHLQCLILCILWWNALRKEKVVNLLNVFKNCGKAKIAAGIYLTHNTKYKTCFESTSLPYHSSFPSPHY